MESNVAPERVESESPKEGAKNEEIFISGDDGNTENSKSPSIVTVVATAEEFVSKEVAENDESVTGSSDGGDTDNSKSPVTVAVVATAEEVASVISPTKTVESLPKEIISPVKNVNKKTLKKEVQVSNTKKPFIFYLNRAKRFINEFNEVELCGLGMAIPTVVTIAEILKRNGFAIQKGIMTSTVLSTQEDRKGRQIEKAKIEIALVKAEKIDAINAIVTPKKAAAAAAADLVDGWN